MRNLANEVIIRNFKEIQRVGKYTLPRKYVEKLQWIPTSPADIAIDESAMCVEFADGEDMNTILSSLLKIRIPSETAEHGIWVHTKPGWIAPHTDYSSSSKQTTIVYCQKGEGCLGMAVTASEYDTRQITAGDIVIFDSRKIHWFCAHTTCRFYVVDTRK